MKNTRADEDRCVENREVNRSQSENPPRSRYSFLRLFAFDLLCSEHGLRSNSRRMNEDGFLRKRRDQRWDQAQYAPANPSQVRYSSVVPRVCPERCLESKCAKWVHLHSFHTSQVQRVRCIRFLDASCNQIYVTRLVSIILYYNYWLYYMMHYNY